MSILEKIVKMKVFVKRSILCRRKAILAFMFLTAAEEECYTAPETGSEVIKYFLQLLAKYFISAL